MIDKLKNISNEKRNLLSNFFSLSVLQIFTYILPLLTLPYLVSVLGVDKYGLVMFAQSFIMFFNIFIDFGFNLSATREIAIHRDNKSKLTEIFSSVVSIKLVLTLLSLIVMTIIVFSFEKFSINWELYYLTFLMVIGQVLFPVWYFQGIEKMKYITIINITSKLIFTIAIFIFIRKESDYILVPILNGLGFVFGGGYSLWVLKKNFKQNFEFQSLQVLKFYFRDSSQFFLSRAFVSVYTSANVFVLGMFTNTTMVGYYSVAEKFYYALQGLSGPITQVLYPYVAKEKNIQLFKKILYFVVVVNVLGTILLYFLGMDFFAILFTKEIAFESVIVFKILLLANVIVVPSIMIGYPFLGALGFAKYANMSVIYASIVHIVGLFVLAMLNKVTIYNIATMIIVTQLVDFLYRIFGVYKNKLWEIN